MKTPEGSSRTTGEGSITIEFVDRGIPLDEEARKRPWIRPDYRRMYDFQDVAVQTPPNLPSGDSSAGPTKAE